MENKQEKPKETVKDQKDTLAVSALKETEETNPEIVEVITEEVKEEPSSQLTTLSQNEALNFPISKLETPLQMMELASVLVGGKMCPYKTAADAVLSMIAGKELGLSISSTFQGIFPIEGRPTLGVHVKKAILLQNGIIFKKIRDMEVYYTFAKMNEEKQPIPCGNGYIDEQPLNTVKQAIDTRTEYLFIRYFKTPKGIIKNTAIGMYSIKDAEQANLLGKSNWKSYTRDMLASRAFSRGANEIADDLLNGMLSFSEMADINDSVTYYIDDKGNEVIVTDEMINKD